MKLRIKILCLTMVAILSACDKGDDELVFSKHPGLLYQVKFDAELFYEYTYNPAKQIVEEKSKFFYTRHNYHNGRLASSDYYVDPAIFSSASHVVTEAMKRTEWVNPTNTVKSSTKTFSYDNNGKLIRSENNLNICTYSYDPRGRISRQSFYREGELTGYIDFSYDNNDNLIKRLHYWILTSGEPELQTTTVYEYDKKLNPYKAFSSLMLPGRNTNTNNIIKETYTIHFEVDPFINKVQITENSYKYNTQGFPIRKNDQETYLYY